MKVQRLALAAALILSLVIGAAGPADAVARVGSPSLPSMAAHAKRAHRKRPVQKVRTVSFTARVVRSSATGLEVRTADGKLLSFSSQQIKSPAPPTPAKPRKHAAHGRSHSPELQVSSGNVVVDLLGLQPGVVVQITETTDATGTVTITITLPTATPAQGPPARRRRRAA